MFYSGIWFRVIFIFIISLHIPTKWLWALFHFYKNIHLHEIMKKRSDLSFCLIGTMFLSSKTWLNYPMVYSFLQVSSIWGIGKVVLNIWARFWYCELEALIQSLHYRIFFISHFGNSLYKRCHLIVHEVHLLVQLTSVCVWWLNYY